MMTADLIPLVETIKSQHFINIIITQDNSGFLLNHNASSTPLELVYMSTAASATN